MLIGAKNLVKKDVGKVFNHFDSSGILTQEIWSQDWVPGLIVRIPEWFGLGGVLNLTLFQPYHGQGCLPPSQLAPKPVQPGSGHFQG